MKELSVINLIGLGYSVLLAIVTVIFFRDYWIWSVLGSAVALFNHSRSIALSKRKINYANVMSHIGLRYVMYLIVIAFAYFDQKDNGTTILINTYIFLLLGFVSIQIGIFIYHSPLFRKHRHMLLALEQEELANQTVEEDKNDVE